MHLAGGVVVTEWCVFDALRDALADLAPYGFTFTRHGDELCAVVSGECRFIPTRELIGDGDPCALIAEAFGL